MSLTQWLTETDFLPFARKLEFYPPFFFFGVKLDLSADYRSLCLKIPLRWYAKNNSGVMFGGIMCLASDPFPALLLQKTLPGTSAWTTAHALSYLRPARSAVEMRIRIIDEELEAMHRGLAEDGRAEREFEYYFHDARGRPVARVRSTALLRRRSVEPR